MRERVFDYWWMLDPDQFSPEVVGARIRHIRRVFDKSQSAIAEMCGMGKNTVSNWEQGRQLPTIPQAVAIADELDLTIDYIYTGRTKTLMNSQAVKVVADPVDTAATQ